MPNGLALAGSALYVSANVSTTTTVTSTLTRIALPGEGTPAPVAVSTELPFACGSGLCWFDTTQLTTPDVPPASTLMRATLSGDAPAPVVTLGPDEAYPGDIVFDGTTFFVTTTDQSSGNAQILRIPADGSAPVALVKGATGGLAFDDICIYWASADGVFSIAKTATAGD